MILYLHGFRSSPRSIKARQLEAHLARGDSQRAGAARSCPCHPREASTLIESIVGDLRDEPLAVIGSSLGGYYATWLAESVPKARDCRVVLLNPATRPDRDLAGWLGPQTVFHSDEIVDVRREHLDELVALRVGTITRPERWLLVAATGDEVLDWREMVARYPGARQRIVEGGDHGLSGFEDHIDAIVDFATIGDDVGAVVGKSA